MRVSPPGAGGRSPGRGSRLSPASQAGRLPVPVPSPRPSVGPWRRPGSGPGRPALSSLSASCLLSLLVRSGTANRHYRQPEPDRIGRESVPTPTLVLPSPSKKKKKKKIAHYLQQLRTEEASLVGRQPGGGWRVRCHAMALCGRRGGPGGSDSGTTRGSLEARPWHLRPRPCPATAARRVSPTGQGTRRKRAPCLPPGWARTVSSSAPWCPEAVASRVWPGRPRGGLCLGFVSGGRRCISGPL